MATLIEQQLHMETWATIFKTEEQARATRRYLEATAPTHAYLIGRRGARFVIEVRCPYKGTLLDLYSGPAMEARWTEAPGIVRIKQERALI